jgi:uncharacterized protein
MNEIINDKQSSRFVMRADENEVYVLYTEDRETIDLYSTYTPAKLRGQGLAAKVVLAAIEYAKEQNLKVIPGCWYVRKFLEKHPEYESIVNR